MVSDITPAGILNAAAVGKVRKSKRTQRKNFGEDVEAEAAKSQATQKAQAPLDAGSIGALFNTLNTQQRIDQKNLDRGHAILDRLEQLRLGIISGQVSKDLLLDLKSMLSQASANVTDPKLKEILLDVEARAAVELAKLNKK